VTVWLWAAVVVSVLVLGWLMVVGAVRVRRLDRLHARTDAARAGLESALERRAGAALAVAAAWEAETARGDGAAAGAARLRAAVAAARAARVTDVDRESAENVLGRVLAGVDRSRLPAPVLEELVDAEQLLVLARRVHNDAVRDIRGLRSRRMVRWLRLAGSAPMPEYFEIADPEFGMTELARPPSQHGIPGVSTAAPEREPDRPVAPPR
jgi:hypothetical protein